MTKMTETARYMMMMMIVVNKDQKPDQLLAREIARLDQIICSLIWCLGFSHWTLGFNIDHEVNHQKQCKSRSNYMHSDFVNKTKLLISDQQCLFCIPRAFENRVGGVWIHLSNKVFNLHLFLGEQEWETGTMQNNRTSTKRENIEI